MATRQVHEFSVLIASSDDGRGVYGCAFRRPSLAGCAETEVRMRNQPSPYAVQRAQRQAAAKRKPTRGGA